MLLGSFLFTAKLSKFSSILALKCFIISPIMSFGKRKGKAKNKKKSYHCVCIPICVCMYMYVSEYTLTCVFAIFALNTFSNSGS
jgi:hypothetical protein